MLLPYVLKKRQKLLYLVNRKILKGQIESELFSSLSYEEKDKIRDGIKIETYQTIEFELYKREDDKEEERRPKYTLKEYSDYQYVVCDECHYFLADSNFNMNTIFSFRFVQEQFADKIRIFMSATINDIRTFIIKDYEKRKYWEVIDAEGSCVEKRKYDSTYHYGFIYNSQERIMYDENIKRISEKTQFEYTMERDYSYIHINILEKRDCIADVIKNNKNKGKWFIFVDSIKFGTSLKETLEKETRRKVVMLKAEYRDDEEATEVVNEIVEKGTIEKADIVISTSVMDNGINLKEENLNHFVLMADTAVEFIQMLGRKRKDNLPLELYIVRQDKNHFVRRKQWVEKRLWIAEKYLDYLKRLEEQVERSPFESAESFCQNKYKKLEGEYMDTQAIIDKRIEEKRKKKNEQEEKLIEEQQINIMRDIFDNPINYRYARNIYNVYKGKLYLNLLSFKNLENLNLYYKRIIDQFDLMGEDAFLKEQLSWLGKKGDEADKIIMEKTKTNVDRALESALKELECLFIKKDEKHPETVTEVTLVKGNIEDEAKDEDNTIKFKERIREYLLILVDNTSDSTRRNRYHKSLKKGDRPISKNIINYLRENYELPFKLKTSRGQYIILRCDCDRKKK